MDLTKIPDDALEKFVRDRVQTWEASAEYARVREGREYYSGKQLIDSKQRWAIGKDGKPYVLTNVPNTIYKDNQYAKLVDQKVNYTLTDPPAVASDDERYQELLTEFFDLQFVRTLNYVGVDMFNAGIGWLYLYTDGQQLSYTQMDPQEIIPIWADKNRESLSAVIRKRQQSEWDADQGKEVVKDYTDLYLPDRVVSWEVVNAQMIRQEDTAYMTQGDTAYSWGRLPFVYFRFNRMGTTLLERVKSLQDGINTLLSHYGDQMLEDTRNTILVLKGYDGEDLGDFRQKLSQYGAVKIAPDTDEGKGGDLSTLRIEVNAENYQSILRILKEKLIENGRGIDAKHERSGQAPNQLNIKSFYTDIDLDANRIELELQASFAYLQHFLRRVHNIPDGTSAKLTFRRNVMVNEESLVQMIVDSRQLLPTEIALTQHPLVSDPAEAMAMLKEERGVQMRELMGRQQGDDPFQPVEP